MPFETHLYDVLEISPKASPNAVKQAFREMARRWHPDKNPDDPGASERFKQINHAWAVLGDPSRRALYDEFGEQSTYYGFDPEMARAMRRQQEAAQFSDFMSGMPGHGTKAWQPSDPGGSDWATAPPGGGVSLDDILGGAIGSGGGTRPYRPSEGMDRAYQRSAPIEEQHRAPRSSRNGWNVSEHTVPGSGGRRAPQPPPRPPYRPPEAHQASARLSFRRAAMGGEGEMDIGGRVVPIVIPPGTRNGDVIDAGGITVAITVDPDPVFSRDGNDLHLSLTLDETQARMGAKVTVPTLDGQVRLSVPPGARPGQVLRLRGKGIPVSPPGDLYVTLMIELHRSTRRGPSPIRFNSKIR